MFDALFEGLAWLIARFYDFIPSYGIAIALLTVAVMLLLAPLTVKSTRSMLAMQKLAPEMKRIQQEHKNDRVALNEAMMAFYKEHQVNPLSGCVPMLLQMPVFIVMYNVISGLKASKGPKYLDKESELYVDLIADRVGGVVEGLPRMPSLGIDLAKSASDALSGSLVTALPYCLLVALVVVTGYYQARQSMARNPKAAEANPQQVMLTKVFPIVFGFISFTIPAGVVVYFLVSNLFRIAQQGLMYQFDPVIKRTVGEEVREVEAKAAEITRRKGSSASRAKDKPSGKPTPSGGGANGSRQSGRVTPKSSSANGRTNRSTKKSKRGR